MSFRNLFGVVFLGLGLSAAAHAQLGVYGMYSVNQNTGVNCLSAAASVCSTGTPSGSSGHVNPQGLSGGVYYDFKTYGPVRFGVDVRGGDEHANKSGSSGAGGTGSVKATYFLAGVRGSVATPISWIKPYAQVSVGYAKSNVTQGLNLSLQDQYLQYEGFVGADVRITSFLDWRAVELGIGNMNRIGNGTANDGNSSVGVRSLGAGVVFHLP
jgi:hypothetical protein